MFDSDLLLGKSAPPALVRLQSDRRV